MVLACTSTLIFSSIISSTPMRPSSSIMVVMSFRCGRLPIVTGSSASSVAARMGRAAFLAPEMRISPSRGLRPPIRSLSTILVLCCSGLGLPLGPLARGVGFRVKGVNGAVHDVLEQYLIDHLLPLDGRQAFKDVTHSDHKVVIAIDLYLNLATGQGFFHKFSNLGGVHRDSSTGLKSGAEL